MLSLALGGALGARRPLCSILPAICIGKSQPGAMRRGRLPAVPPLCATHSPPQRDLALFRSNHRRIRRKMAAHLVRGDDAQSRFRARTGLRPAQHQRSSQMATRIEPVRNAGILGSDHRAEAAVRIEHRLPCVEAALAVEPVDRVPDRIVELDIPVRTRSGSSVSRIIASPGFNSKMP